MTVCLRHVLLRVTSTLRHVLLRVALSRRHVLMSAFSLGVVRKTKRKDARNGDDDKHYLLDDLARQRLTDVDLQRVVDLPQDMELNEWLATHSEYRSASRSRRAAGRRPPRHGAVAA